MIKKFTLRLQSLDRFLQKELWLVDLDKLPWLKRRAYEFLKVIVIIIRGLYRDRCVTEASALTFVTLVSFVPLLAFIFSIAKGLNAQDVLERSIREYLMATPHQVETFSRHLFELVNNTNFTALGLIGLLVVIWSVHQVLGTLEKTFNIIWGLETGRTFARKASDYLLVFLVIPTLVVTSSAFIALSSDRVNAILARRFGEFLVIYEYVFELSGVAGIIIAFSFLYSFIPNTKVRLVPALIGGLTAGILWYLVQFAFIRIHVGVTSYNAIYGAFAAIPVFLIWMYVNWLVVLIGAEVSFAFQNYRNYYEISKGSDISFSNRFRLACLIVYEICRNFDCGNGPWGAGNTFTDDNIAPAVAVRDILSQLAEERVIIGVENNKFVPGAPTELIRLDQIFIAIWKHPDNKLSALENMRDRAIIDHLEREEKSFITQLANTSVASFLKNDKMLNDS